MKESNGEYIGKIYEENDHSLSIRDDRRGFIEGPGIVPITPTRFILFFAKWEIVKKKIKWNRLRTPKDLAARHVDNDGWMWLVEGVNKDTPNIVEGTHYFNREQDMLAAAQRTIMATQAVKAAALAPAEAPPVLEVEAAAMDTDIDEDEGGRRSSTGSTSSESSSSSHAEHDGAVVINQGHSIPVSSVRDGTIELTPNSNDSDEEGQAEERDHPTGALPEASHLELRLAKLERQLLESEREKQLLFAELKQANRELRKRSSGNESLSATNLPDLRKPRLGNYLS
jgi:hypothetical protein